MKNLVLISILTFTSFLTSIAQIVYVDCNIGSDNNSGTKDSPLFSINRAAEMIKQSDNNFYTIEINPGIYTLERHVLVATDKELYGKRIIIKASVLPDDSTWTPEKMPVIISKSNKGEFSGEDSNNIVAFSINESHVTIRGLKFLGYSYPKSFYFPIARLTKNDTDLEVEQCMFLGDMQSSVIQIGIIAHGDSVKVDNCIFYNVNNAVVLYECNIGKDSKTGNSVTNSIIYGAIESAIWTVFPDKDLIFENNIVTKCKVAWVKNTDNPTKYSMKNCVIVNNNIYLGNNNLENKPFDIEENGVIKEGEISLRKINNIFQPLPVDHLHIIEGTLGYNLGAGLFKN